jgi:hydrogenase maturation factor
MMLGVTTRDRLLEPGLARPGNRLLLTKSLALEGTALLANERRQWLLPHLSHEAIDQAADLIRRPGISVAADAEAMLDHGGVTALHDPTEGGLATGARELGACANVGIRIEANAVPIHPATATMAKVFDLDPLGMLASGSLLVAAEPDAVPGLIAAGKRRGILVTPIGDVTSEDDGYTLVRDADRVPLPNYATDEVSRALSVFGPTVAEHDRHPR